MKRIISILIFLSFILLKTGSVGAQDINKVMISIELKGATMQEAFASIEKGTPF
jgi:hypothetical protein